MNIKKKWAVALASSMIALSSASIAAEPIKIGTILSVTGPASFLGDPELKTLQMEIEAINKSGGLLGRQIELIHYDDGGKAASANSFAKRLIDNDNVDIIVGGSTTGSTMSMVPLVEKAEIPFISLAGAVVIIDPVKKWVFKTPLTDKMAAQKVFIDLKNRELTKIALLTDTSGFGKSGKKQAEGVASDYGITVLASESYGSKDTDMTAQLTKIKNTEGVQALFVIGFGQGPALVNKNYKQLGMKLPLYHAHGVASKKFIELSGDSAEGVRLPAEALLIADKLSDDDPQKQVALDYTKNFKAKYGTAVSTFGGYAHDGLKLAVDAIKRAGTTNKAKVRDAIEATQNLAGAVGVFSMSKTDHLGLKLSAFRLLEIKNGDWVEVK